MKKEFALEGLPAPGEALVPAIAKENQQLLEADLQIRLDQLRAKLDKREKARLERRWRKLARKLKRARYNQIVARRWEIMQQCQFLKAELHRPGADVKSVKMRGRQLVAAGRALNDKIAMLTSLADEFRIVANRLKAHNDVLIWERQEAEDRAAFFREKLTWERQIQTVFKQSPRLHYLGKNKRGKDVLKIPKIDHAFIKGDSIFFRIKTSSQNPFERFFNLWHSALPYGVDISSLTDPKTLENLSAACGRVVQVERGKTGVNLLYKISRLDATDGIPNRVLYGRVMEFYPEEDHEKTPWPIGVTGDRKVDWFNFEDTPNSLIAGSPGGGKSNLLNVIIATLVSMNTPDELRLVLIDNKGGIEFTHWEGLRHTIGNMIKEENEVLGALRMIERIVKRRLAAFERIKAKKLSAFNRMVKPEDKLARVVIAIDEMATLIDVEDTDAIQTCLRNITSRGRAVGVNVLICTQHVSVDVVPGPIKTNMAGRIAGKMPSDTASRVILDTGAAALLPPVPGRMVFSLGRSDVIAQSPFISDTDIARAVEISRSMPAPTSREFDAGDSPIVARERFSREDLIALALTRNGGSLSAEALHKLAGGDDVVSLRRMRDMRTALVKDGEPIVYEGQAYKPKQKGKGHVLMLIEQSQEQISATAS